MLELTWRKSSRSGQHGDCVEVAMTPQAMHIRDSKNRAGGHFTVPATRWQNFLTSVKTGQYDG